MLDDLLGRGFSSKVKSLIKVTKTRIDAVRKKRNATHKFLKKDIADLLANGLDINAFGRAEGLVTELIVSSCYDFVEHCCDCVLKNLSALQKRREFSDDCKVAVASLMFAAARFSDLPELRDLRQIFQGRYGNSFDHYINQKFVKNLSAKPASMESKMQLMQDIALQYSLVWNAKAFEQRMSMPQVSTQKEHVDYGSFCGVDKGIKAANIYKKDAANCTSLRGLFDRPNQDSKENANSLDEARDEKSFDDILCGNVNNALNTNDDVTMGRAASILDRKTSKLSSRRGIEVSDDSKPHDHSQFRGIEEVSHTADSHTPKEPFSSSSKNIKAQNYEEYVTADHQQCGSSSPEIKSNIFAEGYKSVEITESATPRMILHRKPTTSFTGERKLSSETENHHIGSLASSTQKQKGFLIKEQVQETDEAKIKHFHPPPYVKPSKVAHDTADLVSPQVSVVDYVMLESSSTHDGIQGMFDNPKCVKSTNGHVKPPKASRHGSHKGIGRHLDDTDHIRSKSEIQVKERGRTMSHNQNDASTDHDDIARLILPKPRSTRRRSTRSSSNDSCHNVSSDKCDEKKTVSRTSDRRRRRESRRIKQRTLVDMDTDIPIKDEDKMLDNLLIHYSSKPLNLDTVEDALKKTSEGQERTPFPSRSVSLPREQSFTLKPAKVFARAATFQLDRAAQHVHPKLPDYDDLAARFSGMKAKF